MESNHFYLTYGLVMGISHFIFNKCTKNSNKSYIVCHTDVSKQANKVHFISIGNVKIIENHPTYTIMVIVYSFVG